MYECPSCGESFEKKVPFCERCGWKMDEAGEGSRCPGCGVENDADARFCIACGEDLADPKAAGPPHVFCPVCGEGVEKDARFCIACGERLAEPEARCPACGEDMKDARFCPLCGAQIGAQPAKRIGLLVGGALLAVVLPVLWLASVHRSDTRSAEAVQVYQPEVMDDSTSSVAAQINGEEIGREAFFRLLDNAKVPYERQYGAQVFKGERGKAMLGQLAASTMDRLINRRLLVQEATRAGTPEVLEEDVAIEIETIKRENNLSDQELEERLALGGRTLRDLREDLREQLFIQRFVESEIVGGARSKEERQYLFSRWFSNLKTTANITIFLAQARPTAASAGCGAGGGGCGGSSSCSGSCGSGVTQPLDPRIEAEAKAKALEYYRATYGTAEVVAKVSNYGCHIQVDIVEGNEVTKSFTYSGGQIFEI